MLTRVSGLRAGIVAFNSGSLAGSSVGRTASRRRTIASALRKMLARLSLLKTGGGLNAGSRVGKVDSCQIQVLVIKACFQSPNFRAEPARHVVIAVDGNADLAVLDDGSDFHVSESAGVNSDLHLDGSGCGRGVNSGGNARLRACIQRSGVEHLVRWRERCWLRCGGSWYAWGWCGRYR